jgi:drug/metabolite transporter (DMT)-like permease
VTLTVEVAPQRTNEERGLIAASVAVFVWGLGPLFVRAMGVSTPTVVVYRFAFGTPLLVIVAVLLGGRFTRELIAAAVAPGVMFGVSMIIGFAAVLHTSIANATLIGNTMPVLVVVIAKFVYREHVRIRQIIAAAVAVIGVVIVVIGAGKTADASLVGDTLAIVNVGLWTAYFLRMKRLRDRGLHSWALLACVSTIASLVAIPPCLLVSDDLGAVAGRDWLYVAGMVIGPGLLGHGLMTWASRHLRLTVSSLLTLASPVVSGVGAWLWLGQSMSLVQVLGATVVLVALAGIAFNARIEAISAAAMSDPPE